MKLYLVMRLHESVDLKIVSGKVLTSKIEGIAGYMCCYKTLKQAQEMAENGLYQIKVVQSSVPAIEQMKPGDEITFKRKLAEKQPASLVTPKNK